jgi:hypothetical protein
MQENNGDRKRLPVIVRAWGDETVSMFMHRIDNNRVSVGSETKKRPIGLPWGSGVRL